MKCMNSVGTQIGMDRSILGWRSFSSPQLYCPAQYPLAKCSYLVKTKIQNSSLHIVLGHTMGTTIFNDVDIEHFQLCRKLGNYVATEGS